MENALYEAPDSIGDSNDGAGVILSETYEPMSNV